MRFESAWEAGGKNQKYVRQLSKLLAELLKQIEELHKNAVEKFVKSSNFKWMHRNVPTGKGETADETGMVRLKSRLYRPKTLGFTLTPPPMNHHLHHHLSYADSFLVYENIQISILFKKICYKVVIKIPIPIKNVSLMRRLSHFVVVTNLLTVCIRHLK